MNAVFSDKIRFPHVVSAMEHEHIIIKSPVENALIIHCTVSNVFVVEYQGKEISKLCDFLQTLKIVRLQTTCKSIYDNLIKDFKYNYVCCQAVYDDNETKGTDPDLVELCQIKKEDLPYIKSTYEMESYIQQLYEHKRLFGFYKDNILVGYVAHHIDETVGALFVKPEFRNNGYGLKIMKAGFLKYSSGIRFCQILEDNKSSILLHKKLNCIFSEKPVYWLYNEEYNYAI